MVGTYEIRLGSAVVGKAEVEKQGLYYRFSCRCRLSGTTIYRVVVSCGEQQADLGVCIPMDGQFGTDKKIPCKRLAEGVPSFLLLPKHQCAKGKFVAVYPEEPFAYMSRLKDAYLEIRQGQPGVVIVE